MATKTPTMGATKMTDEQLAASKARRLRQLLCDANDPDIGIATPAVLERRRVLQLEIDRLRDEGTPLLSVARVRQLPT